MQRPRKQTKSKNAPYCTPLAVQLTGYTSSLGDEDGVVRGGALRALEVFGDESVMPLLEKVAAQDEYRHPFNGTYSNRVAAQKTIEAIRARLQPEPEPE